jgi:hypothetical protein
MCFKKFFEGFKRFDQTGSFIEPELHVGDVLVDKVWGDNVLEITQISKNGKEARYKYLKLDGKDISATVCQNYF